MSDDALRRHARGLEAGDPGAEVPALRAALRAGEVDVARLRVAALAGDAVAAAVLGVDERLPAPRERPAWLAWLRSGAASRALGRAERARAEALADWVEALGEHLDAEAYRPVLRALLFAGAHAWESFEHAREVVEWAHDEAPPRVARLLAEELAPSVDLHALPEQVLEALRAWGRGRAWSHPPAPRPPAEDDAPVAKLSRASLDDAWGRGQALRIAAEEAGGWALFTGGDRRCPIPAGVGRAWLWRLAAAAGLDVLEPGLQEGELSGADWGVGIPEARFGLVIALGGATPRAELTCSSPART